MADFIESDRNVCLRPGSGKQYSLQRAVVQLGRTLEWGSRGRGFKSRQPEISKADKHVLCLCAPERENRSSLYRFLSGCRRSCPPAQSRSFKIDATWNSVDPLIQRELPDTG